MLKKILIVTDNTREQVNGVVTTYKNLEKLAYRDGYSVVYIDPGLYPNCACPGYPEVRLSWCWQIGKEIKAIDPQHIHIATEGPLGIAAKLYCDNNDLKYTTAYHTKFPEFAKKIYGVPKWLTVRYLNWFHRHSQAVLTTSDSMVKTLKDTGITSLGVSWTRGVDRSELQSTKIWQHSKTNPTVLYVGRVSKEKNLDDLCSLQHIYNIEIVGDGPYLNTLKQKYTKVKFLGYQKGPRLADSYARADVFAFPSRADTFGIVMIEAQSLGTPVAAYPVEGPLDVVTPGVDGVLDTNLDRAIERCLSLDRNTVANSSSKWTWERCWQIFKNNLVEL